MRTLISVLLLVAAGACGDDGGNVIPDAAPPLPDGAPDAPPAAVTLTITEGTTPKAGVKVYFQNADSSLVSATMTDATGVASAVMQPGGFVTAVNPFAGANGIQLDDLRTFAGVKPGDQLKLTEQDGVAGINMTAIVPYDSAAIAYHVYTSCGSDIIQPSGSGGQSGTLALAGCPATGEILVETRDANGTLGFLYKANVAFSSGGTLDVSGESYTAGSNITLAYTNVPAAYDSVSASGYLYTSTGLVFTDETSAPVMTGSANATAKRPTSLTNPVSLFDSRLFDGALGDHHVFEWGATGNYSLDVNGLLLPEYSTLATLDPSARTIGWTSAATGATPDFALVLILAQRSSPALAYAWQIVAPYNSTTVTLPQLPGDASQYNPLATDDSYIEELITAKVPGGYDAVRAKILSTYGPFDLVAGASGRIVFEAMNDNPPAIKVPSKPRPDAQWFARPTAR